MTRALVVGHDHVAGLGVLEPALAGRGLVTEQLTVVPAERFTDPDVEFTFPDPRGWDLVVTLGAPWPRRDIRGWAAREVAFLRAAHVAGVPVLAICFGAQLLAEALGGTVRPLSRPRVGCYEIRPVDSSTVPSGPWFRWNSDQLVAPPGAEVLATDDDGCQVFRAGSSVGLQFHPEMSPDLLESWLGLAGPDGLEVERLRADTAHRAPHSGIDVARLLEAVVTSRPSGRDQCRSPA